MRFQRSACDEPRTDTANGFSAFAGTAERALQSARLRSLSGRGQIRRFADSRLKDVDRQGLKAIGHR